MATEAKSTTIPNPTHETMMDVCPRCGGATVLAHPGDVCDGCRLTETQTYPRCADCGHIARAHDKNACWSCARASRSTQERQCDGYRLPEPKPTKSEAMERPVEVTRRPLFAAYHPRPGLRMEGRQPVLGDCVTWGPNCFGQEGVAEHDPVEDAMRRDEARAYDRSDGRVP